MTAALVIGRRRPGRPIAAAVREAAQLLEAAGWTVETAVVKRKRAMRHRVAAAVAAKVDVVVAVGGDGAVLQAVQGLAETPAALGIVPMGTGNLLATNLGVPRHIDKAVGVVLGGYQRQIDLGRVSYGKKQRFFSVACGIGFDAKVMDATAMRQKQRFGKLAYLASALRHGRSVRNTRYRLVIDDRETTMDAAQILIANFGRTGLGLKPRLEIAPDDGQLDVIAIRARGPGDGLVAIWEALRQRQAGKSRSGRVLRAHARSVEVQASSKRLVEIDGSVLGPTPIAVSIQPGALRVIVPPTG